MLELNNNTISFEDSIIFVAPDKEKAEQSFKNMKDVKITDFTKYDIIDNSVLPSGEIHLNLYNNTKLPSQYITFAVVDEVLFVQKKYDIKKKIIERFGQKGDGSVISFIDTMDSAINSSCLVKSNTQGFLEYYVYEERNGMIEQVIETTSLSEASEVFYTI